MPQIDGSPKPLTKKQKHQLDRIITSLSEYLSTPEGNEFYDQFENLMSRIGNRSKQPEVLLTSQEDKAFKFIMKELKRGHSPSVREVAEVIGLRSSRSGSRMIQILIKKGCIKKSVDGQRIEYV